MNLGAKINELRRKKQITQEELAAELGVTAAAVSKWENGYTMPDILMLCALADFFQVTTDLLLGRQEPVKYAIIAAKTSKWGESIKKLVASYGFVTKQICVNYTEALECAAEDKSVTHLFVSFDSPSHEIESTRAPEHLHIIESQAIALEQVLAGFEIYLRNMAAYDLTSKKHPLDL